MDDVRKFCQVMMESKEDIFFAIVSRETQTHIGNVRVGSIDWDQKVTGFGILIGDEEFRGKGIGTEVMELIKELCFVELGLNELRFPVVCENQAAIRLYRRADFREAGACSRNFEKSGRSLPQVEFVETAVEWKNRSRAGSVECRTPQ